MFTINRSQFITITKQHQKASTATKTRTNFTQFHQYSIMFTINRSQFIIIAKQHQKASTSTKTRTNFTQFHQNRN
ncbi:hypothetical protein Hanom_Chr17g01534921 [Helianthus anomalus]